MSVALQVDGNSAKQNDASKLACTRLFHIMRDGHVLPTIDGQHERFCVIQWPAEFEQGWARNCLHVRLVTR